MRAVDGQARRDLKGLYMGLFTGKTVIVTGGGKATLKDGSAGSIGYGIDIAFAKEGANLVITGRNVAKLEAAKESLEAEYGVKVLPVQADVSAVRTTRPSSRTSSTRPLRSSAASTPSSTMLRPALRA